MTIKLERGSLDNQLLQVREAMESYQKAHPNAEVSFYKQNPSSIRICVVDPDFASIPKEERAEAIWWALGDVDDATYGNVTMLVLLTPTEVPESLLYMEFKDPCSSML